MSLTDGASWFLTYDSSVCADAAPGGAVLSRFPPGSTTPTLTLTSANGMVFNCSMVGDERGGVWVQQDGQLSRIGASGPTGDVVFGRGSRVVRCANADPACWEVWGRSDSLTSILRSAADGTLLQTFTPPSQNEILVWDVSP